MALPAYSEAVKAMLDRLGPLALARLEKMITDPKSKDRDVLDAAKLILARVAPEPKVDSSASAAGRTTLMIGTSSTVAAIMEKGKARLGHQSALLEEPEESGPQGETAATVED